MNPRLVPTSRLARSVLRTQSDERLLELVRSGSDPAFEAIVARYRRSLQRHCARLVGDADSEEAVQEALLRAHAALGRGARVRNVRAWLHVIAHNAALNILRVRASRQECTRDGDEPAALHDRTSEQREQLSDLLAALQSLPPRQRDAIVLRELAGLSYEQIADRLGTSDGAVRQLLYRARDAVRDRFGALTGFEPVLRYVLDGGSGGQVAAAARIGGLSGGCALTVKVCGAALLPATVVGTVGGAGTNPTRHRRTTTTTTTPTATTKRTTASRHIVPAAAVRAPTQPAHIPTTTRSTQTVAAVIHTSTTQTRTQDQVASTPSKLTRTLRPSTATSPPATAPGPQHAQVALAPARAPPPQARQAPGTPGTPGNSSGGLAAAGPPTTVPRQ
jgi:RNA polymerase sigma factor (sigma-70 family)